MSDRLTEAADNLGAIRAFVLRVICAPCFSSSPVFVFAVPEV